MSTHSDVKSRFTFGGGATTAVKSVMTSQLWEETCRTAELLFAGLEVGARKNCMETKEEDRNPCDFCKFINWLSEIKSMCHAILILYTNRMAKNYTPTLTHPPFLVTDFASQSHLEFHQHSRLCNNNTGNSTVFFLWKSSQDLPHMKESVTVLFSTEP